jgi:xylulokinase
VLLGIDLGTSSVKVAIVANDGSVTEVATESYAVDSPQPGWAESDPAAWWLATRRAAASLDVANLREVEAVGLAGQMHGVVLTSEDGRPLRPAILWADGRSEQQLESYRALDPALIRRLGNPLATGMAGPSLLWIKSHEPSVYDGARWALQPKDWLRMQLTGKALTEATDASATLLYDLEQETWSQDLLQELDLRPNLLAEIVSSYDRAGLLTDQSAHELRLVPGIPIATGAADVAASLVGRGIVDSGPVLLTIGTGAQLASVRRDMRPDPTKRTHLYRTIEAGKWYSMAAILNAGLALEWVRNVFGIGWEELYGSVVHSPPGAQGVVFCPYLVGERFPEDDPYAGGSWSGIELGHRREHLLKAALEGVAFSLREAMETLEATGCVVSDVQLAGGGTMDQQWRQLLADVLGRRLMAFTAPAGSARGAALLGGLAAGVYRSPSDLSTLPMTLVLAAEPGPDTREYSHLYERWCRRRDLNSGLLFRSSSGRPQDP